MGRALPTWDFSWVNFKNVFIFGPYAEVENYIILEIVKKVFKPYHRCILYSVEFWRLLLATVYKLHDQGERVGQKWLRLPT